MPLSKGFGESIPFACQDWANTKAAYRFFSNARVSEQEILSGHFESTQMRVEQTQGKILVLHDTTEFTFQREDPQSIGITNYAQGTRANEKGRRRTVCGLLMHSSLAVTPAGLPLGLGSVKFWTRKKFKGCNALKRKINPTRVPIEKKESVRWLENLRQSTDLFGQPHRCVHIGDRESDIYELFCEAEDWKTHFLLRTCADRLAENGTTRVSEVMKEIRVQGHHWIEVRDKQGNLLPVLIDIKYHRIQIQPPIDKSSRYPALFLTVIHAQEVGNPKNRDSIDWKLITNLPVKSAASAVEKIQWYALRWKIEVFHKILKSGCKIEESKLRTAQRLTNLIAVCCILGWRIFWMTMVQRVEESAKAETALTEVEIVILEKLKPDKSSDRSLGNYMRKIAMLGGYLARANDPPPGNKVMWRGLTRLMDIHLGYVLYSKNVGN